MSQNIYDNPGFFEGYAQLPRSQKGLAGAPEWPALQAMLPALTGKRVLDLGCGYGWFCRAVREQGAGETVGIDLSAKMLARAAELTRDEGIHYRQGDLSRLELTGERFDLIYSSLTLHYLPQVDTLFEQIHGALGAGGSFVFSVEHPIFTCPQPQGWLVDEEGRCSWPINGYQAEGKRVSNWLAEGVIKYHRTLGTYLNALIAAGFEIRHVEDWGPTAEQIAANPALAEEAERPMLLLVSVQKPQG